MVCYVWSISFARRYQRMVSVITGGVYIGSLVPIQISEGDELLQINPKYIMRIEEV